jgi:hypothetical protein
MTRQFHVFPCQHSFHSDCIADELLNHPIKSTKLKYLQSKLNENSRFREDLESLIGEECIFCSDMMIRYIDVDLVQDPDVL